MSKSGIEKLESFGIKSQGAAVLQHAEKNKITDDEFFEKSAYLLQDIEEVVQDEVIGNLPDYYGRWHPSGFMVYPLGSHDELGGLRLHIWPQEMRRREIKGLGMMGSEGVYDGDIHNHAWHIASLALNGEYSDNFYDIEKIKAAPGSISDEDVALRGLWHVFQVRYRTDTEPEALRTTGAYVSATVSESRSVQRGDLHFIEAGPFHAPTIPDERLSATLVFNSARVNQGGPDILISGSSDPIVGNRLEVTKEEASIARSQLM